MTAYLVTGGAGFIGSHLVEGLVRPGNSVRVFDSLTAGTLDNLASVRDQVEVIVGDLHDLDALRRAAAGMEVIYHLAANPPQRARAEEAHPTAAPGTGTLHVLIAAKETGVRRVVYASCASVYGDAGSGQRLSESAPTAPAAPDAVEKLIGEQHCVAFTSMYGLDTVRLRYFSVFGPRQSAWSPGAKVIAILEAMLAGTSPMIPEAAAHAPQDIIYVGDVVYANCLAPELPRAAGKVFNIGRGRPTSLLDIVARVNAILGTAIQPVSGKRAEEGAAPLLADVTLAESHLGLCASTDLEHALQLCLAYYKVKHHPPDMIYKPHAPAVREPRPGGSGPPQRTPAHGPVRFADHNGEEAP